MIPDAEILAAVRGHRMPIERKRLAGKLGIDDNAEFAGALSRLVRENVLDRIARPGPGKSYGYSYWLTPAGKRALNPATEPARSPQIPTEEPLMSRNDEAQTRRDKIIAHITAHPGALASTIAENLGLNRQVVHRDLFAMMAAGQVHHAGETRPFGYDVGPGDGDRPAKAPKTKKPEKAKKAAKAKPKTLRRGRRPKDDTLLASKRRVTAAPVPTNGFRVALTSDDTLVMERPDTKEHVELQRHEITVLTAFLRRLDQVGTLTR